MNRSIAVMAGTFREASDYIKKQGLPVRSTGIIVDDRDLFSLCGNVDLHFIGSYKDNPLYQGEALWYLRYLVDNGIRPVKFIGEVKDDSR